MEQNTSQFKFFASIMNANRLLDGRMLEQTASDIVFEYSVPRKRESIIEVFALKDVVRMWLRPERDTLIVNKPAIDGKLSGLCYVLAGTEKHLVLHMLEGVNKGNTLMIERGLVRLSKEGKLGLQDFTYSGLAQGEDITVQSEGSLELEAKRAMSKGTPVSASASDDNEMSPQSNVEEEPLEAEVDDFASGAPEVEAETDPVEAPPVQPEAEAVKIPQGASRRRGNARVPTPPVVVAPPVTSFEDEFDTPTTAPTVAPAEDADFEVAPPAIVKAPVTAFTDDDDWS